MNDILDEYNEIFASQEYLFHITSDFLHTVQQIGVSTNDIKELQSTRIIYSVYVQVMTQHRAYFLLHIPNPNMNVTYFFLPVSDCRSLCLGSYTYQPLRVQLAASACLLYAFKQLETSQSASLRVM